MTETDVSNVAPMERSDLRDSELEGNPARRCKAHRKNGDQCRKWAIQGGNVCATHGGRARQVVAKARLRLMENADPAVKQLLKIAFDDNSPIETRLKATLAAIDRAGLSPKTEVELEITAKPFEAILDSLDSGSRSEFRRSRGIEGSEETPQIAPFDPLRPDDDDDLIVEGEWLGELDDDGLGDIDDDRELFTPGDWERGTDAELRPDDRGTEVFGGPLGPHGPSGGGMMPMTEAVAAQAEMRRVARSARSSAVLRPIQRALPRGRA